MHSASLLVLALTAQGAASLPPKTPPGSTAHLFASPDLAVPEAPAHQLLTLGSHPRPDVFASPARARVQAHSSQRGSNATTNTVLSGVYPVVNVTWGNRAGAAAAGQSFVSYIDTGSADTFAVSADFACLGGQGRTSTSSGLSVGISARDVPQSACNFGPLYDARAGQFTNLTDLRFSISYFPEDETLDGSMVLAPISVGGLAVAQQQVALVEAATWTGDGVTSGLLGMGYAAVTSGVNRSTGARAPAYSPFFTRLSASSGVPAVFSLAIDRVARGTPHWAAAGMLALGGLVPASYYEGNFTSVAIETGLTGEHTFYTTTVDLVYGRARTELETELGLPPLRVAERFPAIVDSGTAPNFVPTVAAHAINALFEPAAVYNATLDYFVVDCNATAPYVAFRVGGVEMPVDARDMIVRSLNGLLGYEEVCFSAIADGGVGQQILGSTWQRSYVVAYDQGQSKLHFAKRRAY